MHLHCTKKLIEQLGLVTADLAASQPSNRIHVWHAHIVFIARSKTLIAVNDQTFYAVIMPRVKKMPLEHFENQFRFSLSASLRSEGFQDHHAEFLFGGGIVYQKTHNHQALGVLKEAVQHIRYHVEARDGWDFTDVVELTKQINRTPWLAGTRSPVFPIEKITDDLKSLSFRSV